MRTWIYSVTGIAATACMLTLSAVALPQSQRVTPEQRQRNAAVRLQGLQQLQKTAQSRPGANIAVHADYVGKPLPELVRYSDVIVYGRITSVSDAYEYFAEANQDYAVKVLKTIKPKNANIPTVSFPQIGGKLWFGPNQFVNFSESSNPACTVGDEYILFLKEVERDFFERGFRRDYILATGPQSKLIVRNGLVYSVVGKQYDGVPVDSVIAEIERLS